MKMNFEILLSAVFIATIELTSFGTGSHILALFPYSGRSHNIMFEAITKGLARNGHQVDVISHFTPKDPPANYRTVVDLNGTQEASSISFDLAKELDADPTYYVATTGSINCELMGLDSIQDFIKREKKGLKYDILITEAFGANCFIGFGFVFRIPVVVISTTSEYPWIAHYTRNGDNPAYVPYNFSFNTKLMNFWARLKNLLMYYREIYYFNHYTHDVQTDAMRRYLDPRIPSIRDVEGMVALVLTNSHPIMNGVKPMLPTIVQVSGVHIEENNDTLSPDLEKWMNESVDGVIYFSLGSMVQVETLPTDKLLTIYQSFNNIKPVRVLMKSNSPEKLPPGLPDNVRTFDWIQQIPVLAHKNTLAFITHGGFMGCIEALYFGVPLIGMPLFNDQPRNIQILADKRIAIMLDLDKLTEEQLTRALTDIRKDTFYKDNAVYFSKIYRDRPMSAMSTATYWIEYLIRNGPHVLHTSAIHYTWWQLALLDLYGFLLLCIITACLIVYLLFWLIVWKFIPYTKSQLTVKKKLT